MKKVEWKLVSISGFNWAEYLLTQEVGELPPPLLALFDIGVCFPFAFWLQIKVRCDMVGEEEPEEEEEDDESIVEEPAKDDEETDDDSDSDEEEEDDE